MKFYFAQVDADLGILWPSVHPDQHAALRDASSLPQVPDYSKYFEYPRYRYSKILPWELAFYITHNCMSRINIGQCIRAEHALLWLCGTALLSVQYILARNVTKSCETDEMWQQLFCTVLPFIKVTWFFCDKCCSYTAWILTTACILHSRHRARQGRNRLALQKYHNVCICFPEL